MSKRVSMSEGRFDDLVVAAMDSPCVCSVRKDHDGKCISCWAIANRIEKWRSYMRAPRSAGDVFWEGRIASLESEQRLRAEQTAEIVALRGALTGETKS